MPRYEFTPGAGWAASTAYRVDTASGSTSPATIEFAYTPGLAIPGSIVRANDQGVIPDFVSTAATLYLKRLDAYGTVVGSPTTITGLELEVPPPTAGAGITGTGGSTITTTTQIANDTALRGTYAASGLVAQRTDVQLFDASGSHTWQKPAGAVWVDVLVADGGAGGGSGRRGAAGTVRCAGGAGASGGLTWQRLRASDLPETVQVTVGAGGAGGAAVTTDNTDGSPGSAGGRSLFGPSTFGYAKTAVASSPGAGGTATSGAGGAGASNAGGIAPSLAGGSASTSGGAGGVGTGAGAASWGMGLAGCGGGAGGGVTAADLAANGGAGGSPAYSSANGGAGGVAGGAAPTQPVTYTLSGGPGGGGGAGSITGPAQAGAKGGRASGGGGGGAVLNGFPSGAGGAGGDGFVSITTTCGPLVETGGCVGWGDSLTAGAGGGGTSWRSVLAGLTGRSVANQAVGGETSTQIAARAGAIPTTITLTGNSLPATGTVVATTSTGIVSAQGSPLSGSILGIPVTLSYNAGQVLVQRKEQATAATPVPAGTTLLLEAGPASTWLRQIIWVGRNDVPTLTSVKANIDSIIATGRTGLYIVLGVTNTSAEPNGSANLTAINALNSTLATAYGSRFLDIRAYLTSAQALTDASITATAQDTTDLANGVIPTSLRSDATHLNAAGYTLVAQQINAKIQALGWT